MVLPHAAHLTPEVRSRHLGSAPPLKILNDTLSVSSVVGVKYHSVLARYLPTG